MLYTKFDSIWPSGSTEEVKHVKGLHTDGLIAGRRTGDQKSSLETSVQVSKKKCSEMMMFIFYGYVGPFHSYKVFCPPPPEKLYKIIRWLQAR